MTFHLMLLAAGLAFLLGGGDLLVRGASGLAKSFKISPLVIGLTVVSFGTSAPELSVNLMAAVQDSADISFGNIMGSNIANIGLILGICALIRPLDIEGAIITREIPMMVLASLLALVTGLDDLLRHAPDIYDRSDGAVFLLIFSVFLYYTVGDVILKRKTDPLLRQVEASPVKKSFTKILSNLLLFMTGLILLVYGGKIAVEAAVVLADLLNVPKVIIGLTIIAVGTSLPELATSGIAAWKGQTDIAIGNVVGSNIFNLLLINGLCASVRPIPIPVSGGRLDLFMMISFALLLLPLSLTDRKKIVRWEGGLLLTLYCMFNVWRIYSG